MKPLFSILTARPAVPSVLLRWASPGIWLALAALAGIALWGAIDPFGLRQRLDWMVADQFLRHRSPPALHPDLLQISIDDQAARQLGITDSRHRLARALRQLSALGARTVLVDVLFLERGSTNPFDQEEAIYDGFPIVVTDPDDKLRYLEDQLLAESLASLERVVIPFQLDTAPSLPGPEEAAVESMSRAFQDKPEANAESLARDLGLPADLGRRLVEPALERAALRLAQQPQQAAQMLAGRSEASPLYARLRTELDRKDTVAAVRAHESFTPEARQGLIETRQIQVPPWSLAESASLGFADVDLDEDGVLRRLAGVALWQGRCLVHQGLVGLARHVDVMTERMTLDPQKRLRLDADRIIPLDQHGQIAINWPMNARQDWVAVIPQLSVADLLELARFQADILDTRHRLREKIAILARQAGVEGGWDKHFEQILTEYALGNRADAVRYEESFDEKAIPQVLNDPRVQQATQEAMGQASEELGLSGQPGEENTLINLARAVLDIQQYLPQAERARQNTLSDLRDRVQGKLCFVGDTRTGSVDFKLTPVGTMPGVSVIVAAVNTAITRAYLTVTGYPASVLLMLLVAGGLSVPLVRLRPIPAGACGLVGLGAALFGTFALLSLGSIIVSPVTPIVGLIAVYLTITTHHWLSEYRQKKLVRTIFEAQTNPTIVERLIEAGQAGIEEVLAAKNRQVTVFFAEIADFEELAHQVAAERLPEVFSRTFGAMAKVILSHEGTLDRYQGHAMVAFFGAPIYQPDHARRACRAALDCRDRLRELARTWQSQQLPMPRIHIGLHTGELLVGNITLTSRVDYTVAGENLNIAYRIGELNDQYGTEIVISESTWNRCEAEIEARELDLVRIKGRREPLRAFELMSAKGELSPVQQELRGSFVAGLSAFRNRDYSSALALFRACRSSAPEDRPTTIYISRCQTEMDEADAASKQRET